MQSYSSSFNENDFTKTILSWSFDTYSKSLDIAVRQQALPSKEQNIQCYYHRFLPFILEEARAIIASGLSQVEQYQREVAAGRRKRDLTHLSEAKPFSLKLQKDARYPRNEGNPLFMAFKGAIPQGIEHGKSMIALLLKTKNTQPEKHFIGLATENQNATELSVKLIMSSDDYYAYGICFKADQVWEAHYLGSVVSEQRMYDTCLEAIDTPCIRSIARAKIDTPRIGRPSFLSSDLDTLNSSQRQAIYGFLNARDNETVLLEGPPGTGKTTTLIHLLMETVAQNARTLVSAHSNKGVQVLASRALIKMPDTRMILVGVESKLPEDLKPIFLHHWYDRIINAFTTFLEEIETLSKNPSVNISLAHDDLLRQLTENLTSAQAALTKFFLIGSNSLTSTPLLEGDFQRLFQHINNLNAGKTKKKWGALKTALEIVQEKWVSISKEELEMHLLDQAQIVFATLITCGRRSLQDMDPVDYLLVDEASQSVEAATLIPMRFQPKKILLVGDTKQLPATVISDILDERPEEPHSKHYKWSMMWRLIEENNQPNLMLTIQYRMHPWICQWPSSQFYADRLITAPNMLPMTLPSETGIASRPYAVYQVNGQVESMNGSHSIFNAHEAAYVITMIEHIRRKNKICSIGVITPYVAQKQLINRKLDQKRHLLPFVDVNTVDGFQGDERDIIIISFVRTHVSTFLTEFRRLNVAITRPKACLIILGAPSLTAHDIGNLMRDARERGVLHTEDHLKNILQTGQIPAYAIPQGLRALACHADAESQFLYAQQMEEHDRRLAALWYRRSAENGHPRGQLEMAQRYFYGDDQHVSPDTQLGIVWINKAVDHPLPEAHLFLGMLFILGDKIVKNIDSGLRWCDRAAQANHLAAILFLAKSYQEGKVLANNSMQAMHYYRQGAKLNDPNAIIKLAHLLSDGSDDNKRESIKWFKKSAQNNQAEAYWPLAELLNHFLNDPAGALIWYIKAADEGHTTAQFIVSQRFRDGQHGCPINIETALKYLQMAANSSHTDAQFELGMHLREGNHVQRDQAKALFYFKSAASEGHVEAQYQAGLLMLTTHSAQAYTHFKQAAASHHRAAQYECVRYQLQQGVDWGSCLDFCRLLVNHQHMDIRFILARLLETGLAGVTDKKQAWLYYAELANQHTAARYHAAIFLEEGAFVKKDIAMAKQYYESCVNQQPQAKLRLARLLLQNNPTEAEIEKAMQLVKQYYSSPKRKDGLTPLEESLEKHLSEDIPRTSDEFLASINTPSSEVNFQLAMRFKNGLGVQRDQRNAMIFFEKAAQYQHVESCYQLGILTTISPQESYRYLLTAARQGHLLAQLACVKRQIQEHRDLTDCLSFCEQLADIEPKDDVFFWLARLLDTGVAGKTDKEKAYTLYQSLAQKGHIWAHYYSARMLESGVGIAKNIPEAEALYAACHHVCFDAKLRLACLLLKNQSGQASSALPLLREYNENYSHHVDRQTTELDNHLETWIKKSNSNSAGEDIPLVDTPLSEANYLLGQIYENGKGVKADPIKALRYYQQAGESCSEACYRIGYIHESGLGVPKSWETAKGFYQKAADRGHALAGKRLSWFYGLWGGGTMNDAELQKSSECLIM